MYTYLRFHKIFGSEIKFELLFARPMFICQVEGKRRKPSDDQQVVHSQQISKQRAKKSKLHVAEDLRESSLISDHQVYDDLISDDGESSFIADHQVYDDFLGDDGIVMFS
ncbi:hypothetical protein DCAR_0101560 [Daucus carota subsp. sativus]|uniref:Uncharacterized protein n=1 Tax=Daucus carota subsp. sativus TaxID=79200 RepID=A0A166GGD2_DAUCS|nr:hypothetical protein DCAR_0101560 [Daucus carota subsp. sativus]